MNQEIDVSIPIDVIEPFSWKGKSPNLQADLYVLSEIVATQPAKLYLKMPNNLGILELDKVQNIKPTAIIQASSGIITASRNIATYRGKVFGEQESVATLTIASDFLHILYSTKKENYEINKNGDLYELINTSKIEYTESVCVTEDVHADLHSSSVGGNRDSYGDCLEIHLTIDFPLFNVSNDVVKATLFMMAVFNDVATIYANEGISIVLSSATIWDTTDPFDGTNTQTLKNSYVNYLIANPFVGRVSYMLSGRNLSGGLSHGIGGFCNAISEYPGPCAVSSSIQTPLISYPSYSWNVYSVCHELGHVLGLRHTHACVWNGNDSQIDDCGNVYAEANNLSIEGATCYDPSNPIVPGMNGTIMSTCQLINGSGINFSLGFGEVAGQVLLQNYGNASCITGQNCGNIPPSNDVCDFALPILIKNTCVVKTYDNNLATSSGLTPPIQCGNVGSAQDVWFYAIVPSSGQFTFETSQSNGGLTDIVVQAYSGSCNSLSLLTCDDNSGAGNHSLIQINNRTPGEKIFFRVIDSGSNENGEFNICAYDSNEPCHPDFNALVALYNNTNGSTWVNNSGWNQNASNCDVCSWYGVVCDNNGSVKELNLGNNNLSGNIPASLTSANRIARLNFYNNNFSGPIPDFLNNFPLLHFLDLGQNNFNGSIPNSISQIVNLRTLYLDNNALVGSLPTNFANLDLTALWLQNNQLTGCIPASYNIFCLNDVNVKLNGNVGLPFGGNFILFCNTGAGGDFDGDGFCGGVDDCIDNDALSNPNGIEICDGKDNNCDGTIDENLSSVVLTWTGTLDSLWHKQGNWDLNIVPKSCHDVMIIPSAIDSVVITNGLSAVAASVTVGSQGQLIIQNDASLTITNSGGFINDGYSRIVGELIVSNSSSNIAFINGGEILVKNTGVIAIDSAYIGAISNLINGEIINTGKIQMSYNDLNTGQFGMQNEGMITNTGLISSQNITGKDLIIRVNGMLHNSGSGNVDLRQ